MGGWFRRAHRATRREVGFLALGLLVGTIAFPLAVLASHQFADVPDDNTFHADISAIADAGVTTGCGGGNYCPKEYVTREQMAAFLNRLGALAAGKTPVVNADRLDGLDSSDFVQKEPITGHYNCHGSALFPILGPGDYGTAFGRSANAAGTFGCPLILPDGATITELRAFVRDTSATEEVGPCNISAIVLSTASQYLVAGTGLTGIAFASGNTTLSDTASELVNNGSTAYTTSCGIPGNGSDVTLTAIQVTYTLDAIALP